MQFATAQLANCKLYFAKAKQNAKKNIANRKTKSCRLANEKLQTGKSKVADCMIATASDLATSNV